ncbi:DUF2802 domain-containing protein [Shewanella submarina]|uniref:DUF2802 domain-containing protein n=1 Tax=Shewanella submarina TaxID=2016376 RepID=A0ABV7GHN4_9GAMM|nr:DUF2802 domain-containing protein [Shewanella submarina]MCL1036523.1 DUF2802 domain-containing protein [Shewanella submarina]
MSVNPELLVVVAVFLIALLGLGIWVRQSMRLMTAKLEATTLVLREAEKQTEQLRQELTELRSGTIGVGRRVLDLEKSLKQQQARLEENAEQDPGARLYTRAAKMVGLGAGVDELVAECELPRAEAELLLRLHRKAG